MSTPTEAQKAFRRESARAAQLLTELNALVLKYNAKDPIANYAHVGTLEYVNSQLRQALRALEEVTK